jgi:hypothetical protein
VLSAFYISFPLLRTAPCVREMDPLATEPGAHSWASCMTKNGEVHGRRSTEYRPCTTSSAPGGLAPLKRDGRVTAWTPPQVHSQRISTCRAKEERAPLRPRLGLRDFDEPAGEQKLFFLLNRYIFPPQWNLVDGVTVTNLSLCASISCFAHQASESAQEWGLRWRAYLYGEFSQKKS